MGFVEAGVKGRVYWEQPNALRDDYRMKIDGRWQDGQIFKNGSQMCFIQGFGHETAQGEMVVKTEPANETLSKRVLYDYFDGSLYEHDLLKIDFGTYGSEWLYGEIKLLTEEDVPAWVLDCRECNGKVYDLWKIIKTRDYKHVGNKFDMMAFPEEVVNHPVTGHVQL
jgi:hypothetical protein